MSIEGFVVLAILGGWLAVRFYIARQNEHGKPFPPLRNTMPAPQPTASATPTEPEFKPTEPIIVRLPNPRPADLQQVLLCNDDTTTMVVVVDILVSVFGFSMHEAVTLMMIADQQGTSLVGILDSETARERVNQCQEWADTFKVPLRFTIEPWNGDVPPYISLQAAEAL